jgi:CPA2 family monovalent cation:H+ antiporter-2
VLVSLLIIKTLIILGLGKLFRQEAGVALRTGLVLAPAGEFGFALLVQAGQYNLMKDTYMQIVLAAMVVSMMLAPLLIRFNGRITKRLLPKYRERRESNLDSIRSAAGHAHDHVILCGFGRSGQNLAWMLKEEGLPYVGLDLDPVRVRDARDAGEPVVFGDSARRDVLLAAGLMQARALIISFVDRVIALRILDATHDLRPDMPVIVRTIDDSDIEQLKNAGAAEVVPESLECSLMMGSHLLMLLGVPVSRVLRQVQTVRRNRYRMLRGFFYGAAGVDETEESYRERLHSVTLPQKAHAVGKRLAELPLAESKVTVTAVRRGGITGSEPGPDTRFISGDVLVLFGKPEALEHAEKILLEG